MSLTINLAGVGIAPIYWLIDSNLIYIKLALLYGKPPKTSSRAPRAAQTVARDAAEMGCGVQPPVRGEGRNPSPGLRQRPKALYPNTLRKASEPPAAL